MIKVAFLTLFSDIIIYRQITAIYIDSFFTLKLGISNKFVAACLLIPKKWTL